MTDKIKTYRNGWAASFQKFNGSGYYVAAVLSADGRVHDRVMIDDYRKALEYYRAFQSVAKAA